MGIFTEASMAAVDEDFEIDEAGMEELLEGFFYDDHYADSDEEKKAIFEDAAILEKAKLTNKKTLVRLSKNDDIRRRSTMAAMQIAKTKNDPLWKKLVLNRVKERQLLRAINKKYGNKAIQLAKKGQREYLKGSNKVKMLKASDLNNRQ